MSLTAGTRLGPYEIRELIVQRDGGELYKGTDTRDDRQVAIQTLTARAGDDPGAQARLEQQVAVVARLNHPHVCVVHDTGRARPQHLVSDAAAVSSQGEAPGPTTEPGEMTSEPAEATQPEPAESLDEIDFLILEPLEGQTLARRLEKGALPLKEALDVFIAIADALDKSHQKGVVHRDLTPSSVMLTAAGVKLLDLGVAVPSSSAFRPPSGSGLAPGLSQMKTDVTRATAVAVVDDARHYLAPEQIEGREADARTDIFSLGVLLFEMVTGAKAFEGKNRALLLTAIASLELDPLSKLRPGVPMVLDHIAKRCLEKNPDDRWQTAHDLGIQLRWLAESGAVKSARTGRRDLVSLALAATIVVATVVSASSFFLRETPEAERAFAYRIPVAGLSESDIALSPDGRSIALVARPNAQGGATLFVRDAADTTFRQLGGTEDASQPFWSPDSRSIAFVAGGRLKRVEATGGAPKDIGEAPADLTGGTWGSQGLILLGSSKGLLRVSADGGTPESVTSIEEKQSGHFWPHFLPDGRGYVFTVWSAESGARAVFTGRLDTKERARLMTAESNAAYAAPGFLVYHRAATLFAQPFDAGSLALAGEPVNIADQLSFNPSNGRGNFDVSQSGRLIYHQGGQGVSGRGQAINNAVFGWRDRSGTQLGIAGEQGTYGDMDLSPDGRLIAITRQEGGGGSADIWIIDWQRASVSTRLTLDPSDDINPVWSPTGDRVAFTTFRKGNADIYVKNANGVGPDEPLLESPDNEFIEDWSKDGQFLAYRVSKGAHEDIYVLPLTGDKKPIPIVQGPYRKDEPQFSYDGKWLAYTSDESGSFQVYVTSFPDGKQKLQISQAGGGQPRWRQDGREIFYKAPDNAVMSADFTPRPLATSIPRVMFFAANNVSSRDPVRHQWSVAPDGQRFLLRLANGSGVVAARGGARGSVPSAPNNYTPTGRAAGVNPTAGRSPITYGLTVLDGWPAAFRQENR